jgi:Domain of unknown function (DUF4262)
MSQRDKPQDAEFDKKWVDLVKEHGHAVMCVGNRVDEPSDDPSFAYSTGGYESYGAPEIIVFGLSFDLMHSMINIFFDEWNKGTRFETGEEYGGFLEGFPVVFSACAKRAADDYATSTDWYYERELFPLWQMIWPGSGCGLFPWDYDCPEDVIASQPDLTEEGFGSLRGPLN